MAALAGIVAAVTAVQAPSFALASEGRQNPPRPRPFPGAQTPAAEAAQAQTPQGQVDPALGMQLYPGAELLATYDAGPNQKMYIYGSASTYANVVEFFKTTLKDRGRQLFDGPMHQFDLGRYRRETMMLQPALTVKDYTWNGRDGYVHVSGRQIVKYPTIIQIVPAAPGG